MNSRSPEVGGARAQLLAALTARLLMQEPGHPLRVAIDGPDAAGKTVLADELAEALAAAGREVIRASVDGFHRPRAERYRRGADSAEGYYRDSFDHGAIWSALLDPLGPGGNRRYRLRSFDFRTDTDLDEPEQAAPADAILIFDGVFLLRPELIDGWDYTILVRASAPIRLERALVRDVALFGSSAETERRYRRRYLPGQELYFQEVDPARLASSVIDNDEPDLPMVTFRT